MAHTALYGGTVYEKKGGADLVGGTVYKKDHGKVLVGGTAYEVGFGHPVLIYGGRNGMPCACTVTVDGNSTNFANAVAIETVSNSAVTVASTTPVCKIVVDGETVVNGVGEYTLDLSDATHVQMTGMLTMLTITTYNLAVTGEDVPITIGGAGYTGLAHVEHNGITYTSATTFTAKTGDLILVHSTNPSLGGADYYYLVKDGISEIIVTMSYSTPSAGSSGTATGSVGIREIPEGHALVTINQGSYYLGDTYVSIDGVQYQKSATCVVPIGTVIYCYTRAGNKEDQGSVSITLNGQEVSTVTQLGMGAVRGEYYYTVTGKAKIEMAYDEYDQTSVITITEQ